MKTTTREEREKHIAQMRANQGIEGFEPSAEDLVMQQKYIDGEITLGDMLQQAMKFAEANRNKYGA